MPTQFITNPRHPSETLCVVDTSPSGKVVTIRDATRDEIRFGDAMPHDQAVYWASVFAAETSGARITDTSSHAKSVRRNPNKDYSAMPTQFITNPRRYPNTTSFAKRMGLPSPFFLDSHGMPYQVVAIESNERGAMNFGPTYASLPRPDLRDAKGYRRKNVVLENGDTYTFLVKAAASRRAKTVRKNPASSRPSVKTLSQIVSRTEAVALRDLMESSSVEHVLRSASKMMDGFGVEYIRSSKDTMRTPDGLDFVNMGDTYDLTLVYDHNKGKYVVTSWGDIVEADMRLPKSRQRFAD